MGVVKVHILNGAGAGNCTSTGTGAGPRGICRGVAAGNSGGDGAANCNNIGFGTGAGINAGTNTSATISAWMVQALVFSAAHQGIRETQFAVRMYVKTKFLSVVLSSFYECFGAVLGKQVEVMLLLVPPFRGWLAGKDMNQFAVVELGRG